MEVLETQKLHNAPEAAGWGGWGIIVFVICVAKDNASGIKKHNENYSSLRNMVCYIKCWPCAQKITVRMRIQKKF